MRGFECAFVLVAGYRTKRAQPAHTTLKGPSCGNEPGDLGFREDSPWLGINCPRDCRRDAASLPCYWPWHVPEFFYFVCGVF